MKHAHGEGKTHKEILLQFTNEQEQLAAGAVLSATPEANVLRDHRWGHRILIGSFALLAFTWLISIEVAIDVLLVVGMIWVIVLIKGRNPWGYNSAILVSAWLLLSAIWDLTTISDDIYYGIFLVFASAFSVLLGALAYHLRFRLFPYMGLLGPRRDEKGRPILIEILLDGDEAQSN